LLSHRAGLPAIRELLPAEALYDWQTMVDALAAETPWWAPGTEHGYAAITYGWLIGELIRRVDDRGPGESIVARTARPLGLDFHVGLADEAFHRVAHIARSKGNAGDAAAQRLLQVTMREPEALSTRAFTNPPAILTSTNKPEWRRMQQPAANGHGNARSLAGFYAGLLDGSLLESELLDELTREHSLGQDRTLLTRPRPVSAWVACSTSPMWRMPPSGSVPVPLAIQAQAARSVSPTQSTTWPSVSWSIPSALTCSWIQEPSSWYACLALAFDRVKRVLRNPFDYPQCQRLKCVGKISINFMVYR